MDLLQLKDSGLYCPLGDFTIDPLRRVKRCLITHAHADHARGGMEEYIATHDSAPILRKRLGDISLKTYDYGEKFQLGEVTVSLHPAGHILGSCQVRIEYQNHFVWEFLKVLWFRPWPK